MSYRIYPSLLPVDDTTMKHIETLARTKGGSRIFNPDKKRWQTAILPTDSFYRAFVDALETTGVVRGRRIGTMAVLHSKAGCQQQQWHYDYDPSVVKKVRKKPCGALLALEKGTTLSIHGVGEVALNPGDCLVFEGDCVHAGSAYTKENTRVHVYLDVPTVNRETNITWWY